MTRLQADCALLFAGLIWGFGFVAQKTALDNIGPFTFVAARFLISALFVLPFIVREKGLPRLRAAMLDRRNALKLAILCIAFAVAVLLQQYGLRTTSVTHTAFLTGLYVVMVPLVGALFYGGIISKTTFVAGLLSITGIWLLSGGDPRDLKISLGHGDGLVLLCTFGFAVQVVVLGRLAKRLQLPFSLSGLQYLAVGVIALLLALVFEKIELASLLKAWLPILFAGLASGGIAYTLQAVAQQHTPSADAAVIMSSEALFGGIGGIWLLHEKITVNGIMGCCAIMAAIMLVELGPLMTRGRNRRRKEP